MSQEIADAASSLRLPVTFSSFTRTAPKQGFLVGSIMRRSGALGQTSLGLLNISHKLKACMSSERDVPSLWSAQ
jgi:hypothetical protein